MSTSGIAFKFGLLILFLCMTLAGVVRNHTRPRLSAVGAVPTQSHR
jgi:hypothetical protein